MSTSSRNDWHMRLWRRIRMVRGESGFSLIETVAAIVIFAILAVAIVGLLESAIAANGLARQKSVAQQMAQDQVEWIRQLDYETEVGTPGGNPNGIVPTSKTITVKGLEATMTTDIDWIADPAPGTFATFRDYKKITVRITNNRNGRVMTSVVTYVAPPGRTPFGGINNAVIKVKVQDMGLSTNNFMAGVPVNLATGPSAPLSDVTDATGLVVFPGLTPNPTTGPTAYYDISATQSGFLTYVDDRVPGAAAHVQVAPSQTVGPQVIRLYRPATINVALTDAGGAPYAGAATIKATSQRLGVTKTFASTATPITSFAGDPVVPGDFTLRAFTTTGLCADPLPKYVPDSYPTVMSTTFTLQLNPCPSGGLTVNVTQFGAPSVGSTVTIKDGPNDYTPISQVTGAGGATTFTNLPSGTDTYTITVVDPAGIVTGSGTATVTTGSTTSTTIALGNPPMGSINATVQWLAANVNGATVTVTGGPYGISSSGTTNSSGVVLFSNSIPAGTGYTVTATKNGQSKSVSSVTVTSGSTTNVTLAMPTGSIGVTATWLSIAANAATVTITGGPDGGTYTGTTSAAGTVTIPVPTTSPSNPPYVVSVTKNGGSGTASVTSVPVSTTVPVSIAMGGVGTITVNTATWGGVAVNAGSVSITGGPNGGTYTGTTNASGVSGAISVPATTSSWPYSVTVTKNTGAPSPVPTVNTVTNGANTNISVVLLPTKSITITVQKAAGTNLGSGVAMRISLSGGPVGTAGSAPFYAYTGTTNGSSAIVITNVPAATGFTYSVKADVYNGSTCSTATTNKSTTAGTVSSAAATTTMTLVLNSTTCPLTPWPR